jgi:transglutaminase-like putative cysteine protease
MVYRISHRTTYSYETVVSLGNHVACLMPRTLPDQQQCLTCDLLVSPEPATRSERIDFFGNRLSFFTIQEPHKELVVEALSEVTVMGNKPQDGMAAWEEVVEAVKRERTPENILAQQFVFESPRIRVSPQFAAYARQSFTPHRKFREALIDFTARIFADFRFDSKATTVRTPTEEVFRKRRGVCQDFAHLQIACLRSLKLPARYVSGYLRTYPPPGQERLVGADASHAWVSAYCPSAGWLDVDPTNNLMPSTSHVTVAWGRDYGDVSPLRGLILGGKEHKLAVAVDLRPVDAKPSHV